MTIRATKEALETYRRAEICLEPIPHAPTPICARYHRDYGWAAAACSLFSVGEKQIDFALSAWNQLEGPSSLEYGITLERKARLRALQWKVAAAEGLFREADQVISAAGGQNHPEALSARHGLAFCLENLGQEKEAIGLLQEVLEVRASTSPPPKDLIAWTCHDLAVALHKVGLVADAEPLYSRAYGIRTALESRFAPYSAVGYVACLTRRGAFRKALEVLTETQALLERDASIGAPTRLAVLEMTAYTYVMLGEAQQALAWIAQYDRLATGTSPDPRTAIGILGTTALCMETLGRQDEAIEAWERYQSLHALEFGATSPLRSASDLHLATLLARSEPSRADSVFRSALEFTSPDDASELYSALASSYASFLLQGGSPALASTWARKSMQAASILPSEHRAQSRALLVQARASHALGDPALAWDLALRATRGSLSRYVQNLQAVADPVVRAYRSQETEALNYLILVLSQLPPDASRAEAAWDLAMAFRSAHLAEIARRAQFAPADSLLRLRRQLADALSLDPASLHGTISPTWIGDLQAAITTQETALLLTHPEAALSLPTVSALRASRPGQLTILAYVRYGESKPDQYGCFELTAGGSVRFFALGSASRIDSLSDAISSHMRMAPASLIVNPVDCETDYLHLAGQLRSLVLPELPAGTHALAIIPTGALSHIDFLALPIEDSYLVESVESILVSESEGGLLSQDHPASLPAGLLAVGGINTQNTSDKPGAGYSLLPRSLEEAQQVLQLWSRFRPHELAELLAGDAATEASVAIHAPGKRVLHFATHSIAAATQGQSPLAGLLLSPDSSSISPETDGYWSEVEIPLSDLRGTELAFLSSCHSAGDSAALNELTGLQRALRAAGVKTTILTLWPIGDRPGRDWATTFYKRYLALGEAAPVAAFSTSREILRLRRSQNRPTHPYYWGGFVAVGGTF